MSCLQFHYSGFLSFLVLIPYAVQICGGDIGGASNETPKSRHPNDNVSFDGDEGESIGVNFLLQDRRN